MKIKELNTVMCSQTLPQKISLAKTSESDQSQVLLMQMRQRMEDKAMSQEPKSQMETKMEKITTISSLNLN